MGADIEPTREAYELFAAVVEHVDEGLFVVDEHARLSFVNPAGLAMLGHDAPEELLGTPAHETICCRRPDGSRIASDACPWLKALDSDRSLRGEDWFSRQDGSVLPVSYASAPIRLPGGVGTVIAFHDVSERRREQLGRERERELLNAVLESLDTGIVACDRDGVLSLFNRATRTMHGVADAEQLGPEDWADHYDLFMADGTTPMGVEDIPLFRALRGERVRDLEMVIAPKDRSRRTVLCNGMGIESEDGRALGAVVAMHDVTERRKAEERLAHQALHDSLTGLPNRTLLLDRLAQALATARRDASAVAVMCIDLDHFKLVNDSNGHDVGDELLVAVARRLDDSLRTVDTLGRPAAGTVARLEGDEFVVFCEGLVSERAAAAIAQRMMDALSVPFRVGGADVVATASIGVALSDTNATAEPLVRDAAAAMYRAKERGRARFELFDDTIRTRLVDRSRRKSALQHAIENEELRVHYQPIVSLVDRRVVAAEALVRWEHPEHGLLAPADFIELAEESGLIVALGTWVLRESCRQIARWEQAFGAEIELKVSVNISARQLADRGLAEVVRRAVSDAGVHPSRLALEITETVLMEDGEAPTATLEALTRLGGQLLLDDFGTGYSSLSYLARLPLDTLKLDRSFVAPLGENREGRTIAAAVVELAHALEMNVVAEGVETEDQLRVLEELGCDLAQGYLFARPLPALEMTRLLEAASEADGLLRTSPVLSRGAFETGS